MSTPSFRIYPTAAGEATSPDFRLWINDFPVHVHTARVSRVPLNQVWPGYQRPLDQTEIASFAAWDAEGMVQVRIESTRQIDSLAVKPISLGIQPEIKGNTMTFSMPCPAYATVEVNGFHQALHLFASPLETDIPDPGDPQTLYFAAGEHSPGIVELNSGQTVYLAPGAVVYGGFHARDAENIRICGRGILDQSKLEREDGNGGISMLNCHRIHIEGIILRDPNIWTVTLAACRDIRIDGIKLIGLWRYNADGIDLVNSQDALVENCFIRSFDDSIVLKGFPTFDGFPSGEMAVRDILARRCVIWCDWGRALEIGAETSAPQMTAIRFKDIDIIRTTHIAMDIQHGDRALIHDVSFENIRVEIDDDSPLPVFQTRRDEVYAPDPKVRYCPQLIVLVIAENMWSHDKQRGAIRDIRFKDIRVAGKVIPPSYLGGHDAENDVREVTIENLSVGGRKILSLEEGNFTVDRFVSGVEIR